MVPAQSEVVERPRSLALIRTLIAYHPGLFFVSMIGATVFALCTVASSWALRWVIDESILPRFDEGAHDRGMLALGVTVLVGIAVARAAGVVVRRTWAGKLQWRTAESIAGEVVERLVSQPAAWHRRQRTGDLITRAGVDVEAAVAVLAPLPYASSVMLMMVVAAIGLVVFDVVLGLMAVSVFPLLIFANVLYQRRVDEWFDLAQAELGTLSSAAHESFEAVAVVKAFGAEEIEERRLGAIAERVRTARVRAIRLRSIFESMLDLLPNLTNVAVVLLGAYRVESGHLSIGGLASFIYLFALLVFPLRLVGYALSELPRSQAGNTRIANLMSQPIALDPRSAIAEPDAPSDVPMCVVLREVSARHIEPDASSSNARVDAVPGNDEVLHGVNLDVRCGSVVAIVGPTGCGKTTLLEVIAGILPISAGRVRAPLSTAVVFQEPFLMGASIADNVAMGRIERRRHVDEEGSEHVLQWSLATAEADFVEALPLGADTVVGERGVSLSGGQRQRVALARALFARPELLLLDDTTSALDPVTERKVIDNIRRELPDTTIVSVASRPSLIRIADSVVYMESGSIVARGFHDELMRSSSAYADLISAFERDRSRDGD